MNKEDSVMQPITIDCVSCGKVKVETYTNTINGDIDLKECDGCDTERDSKLNIR